MPNPGCSFDYITSVYVGPMAVAKQIWQLILYTKVEFGCCCFIVVYFVFALFPFVLLSLIDKTNLIIGLMFANFPKVFLSFLKESNCWISTQSWTLATPSTPKLSYRNSRGIWKGHWQRVLHCLGNSLFAITNLFVICWEYCLRKPSQSWTPLKNIQIARSRKKILIIILYSILYCLLSWYWKSIRFWI